MIGEEAGAGCLGSSAPDTASEYDVMVMRLGPVVLVAVLQILLVRLMMMMRLGPVVLVAVLQIPPAMMRH